MAARVLIVDDALFMRNMLKEIFIDGGYEVIGEAGNGIEAVESYRRLQPDLVTMDIVMPLRSGIEALKEIIDDDPAARVVMCSALGQESLILEAVQAGARDFIVKPFKAERVLEVVGRVVAD
ncbi:chemotaxis protein CheY [Desulfuromonas versatilis]|uniref:Chemotaxis protein CheY n=1 Tax=Desulfuromonas versatilis TaxID=2802975 RepID=A0ABM8HY19_9BACT|nr:response regulator [Desulfuromonas versatilis]BCR06863.1 chemotaxis protein CheY [Desulfuromonas versatilis]